MFPVREIVGIANYPQVNKYWVTLSCGHKILYDHSVDAVSEYDAGDSLICYACGAIQPLDEE